MAIHCWVGLIWRHSSCVRVTLSQITIHKYCSSSWTHFVKLTSLGRSFYKLIGLFQKNFLEESCFRRELVNGVGELASWRIGHVVTPGGLATGDGKTLSTWRVPPFVMAKCFFTEIFFKLQMGITFDRNVRLRFIICQNTRN